ncbi:class A beta-lactamase-related serine hydrolase [Ktedonosporobacter rubrisoli]|uniref:Class A beta-lactamase-related serine hydrolase n=1 Tax=Ktedonosporobacter rubrisoli TaxID=2509675 RepID=A0A4P6JKY9_KTERU|nr:serine hydrolase domain-containing protein [Ktedonosporobacter rubrisoli]QBD75877.1 class A beta-lactamase-related serine hydrolase [Ktedonosporobacter rubrisoli]
MMIEIDEIVNAVIGVEEPGVAVAVVKRGRLVHSKGYGLANLEWNIAIQPNTVFRLASVTKQFTATAILLLEQQGKLHLADSLTKYLPSYPTHGHEISIWHLLTHTSGIKPYNEVENFFELYCRRQLSHADVVDMIKDFPLEFAPGTRYKYNNTGYYLLGMIIEVVSGKSYEEFIQTQIFAPLGMEHSYYMWNEKIIPQRASGYSKLEQGYQHAPFLDMTVPYSGGALGSNLDDLVRWDAALREGRLLKKEALERMFTPAQLLDGSRAEYGFGWGIGEYRGHRVAYHQGDMNGFITFIARFLDDEITVILLSNSHGSDIETLFRCIVRQSLALPPLIQKTSSLEPEAIMRMVGAYTLAGMFQFMVEVEQADDTLMLRPFNVELKPLNETTCCFAHDHEIELHFSDEGAQGFSTMAICFPFSPLPLTRVDA